MSQRIICGLWLVVFSVIIGCGKKPSSPTNPSGSATQIIETKEGKMMVIAAPGIPPQR